MRRRRRMGLKRSPEGCGDVAMSGRAVARQIKKIDVKISVSVRMLWSWKDKSAAYKHSLKIKKLAAVEFQLYRREHVADNIVFNKLIREFAEHTGYTQDVVDILPIKKHKEN